MAPFVAKLPACTDSDALDPQLASLLPSEAEFRCLVLDLPAMPPRRLPKAAMGSQLLCALAPSMQAATEVESREFPGESEELQAQWPWLCWEISGIRAVGAAYLTNYRLILHAETGEDDPLDISVADVRSMHLEVSWGVTDAVELTSRSARVRQRLPGGSLPTEQGVDEVLLSCQDLRVIRLIGLREVQEGEPSSGGCTSSSRSSFLHCPETTRQVHQRLLEWAVGSCSSGSNGSGTGRFSPGKGRSRSRIKISAYPWSPDCWGGCWPLSRRPRTISRCKTDPKLSPPLSERRANPGAAFLQISQSSTPGWEIGEDAELEFFQHQRAPRDRWRLSQANEDYELCATYPRALAVPSSADDSLLRKVAAGRASRRLPVLTYYHRKTGSALLRCSQPFGTHAGHQANVTYLEMCRQAVHNYAALTIFDCRSQVAARVNAIKGGGIERNRSFELSTYRAGDVNCATVIALDLPNIYEMRSSWQDLVECVNRSDLPENRWLQRLGSTMWLNHCRRITEAAVTVARSLDRSQPCCVVVHCSDGWDRTTQVCSLAQLLADRRFRTREGFCALVEKDWRRFGHRFAERHLTDGSKAAPIFLQWLFCVSATVKQFPHEFDFSSEDLMLLADLRLSGCIGTFLYNSEKEAREDNAEESQISVWAIWLFGEVVPQDQMLPRLGSFKTAILPHYEKSFPGTAPNGSVSVVPPGALLLPVTSLKEFSLWNWALRFDEVEWSRQKVYSRGVDMGIPQQLGRRLTVLLRKTCSAECQDCHCDFGPQRWRHHCLGCGQVFCVNCVQWWARLMNVEGQPRPRKSRVCRRCFELAARATRNCSLSRRSPSECAMAETCQLFA